MIKFKINFHTSKFEFVKSVRLYSLVLLICVNRFSLSSCRLDRKGTGGSCQVDWKTSTAFYLSGRLRPRFPPSDLCAQTPVCCCPPVSCGDSVPVSRSFSGRVQEQIWVAPPSSALASPTSNRAGSSGRPREARGVAGTTASPRACAASPRTAELSEPHRSCSQEAVPLRPRTRSGRASRSTARSARPAQNPHLRVSQGPGASGLRSHWSALTLPR